MAGLELSDFDVIPWTETDEARPDVTAPTPPAQLSARGQRVLRANPKLRKVWNKSENSFPSDSERAYSVAYHAGHAGLSKEDATWLLCDLYSRPGKKKLHRSKLAKTLRAWAKGREDAEGDPASASIETLIGTKTAGTGKTPDRPHEAESYEVLAAPDFLRASFAGAVRLVHSIGLTECGVGLVSGAGGEGKSVLGLNLALAWAGATLPLGEAIPAARRLRVMVFQVEDTPGIVQERLSKMVGSAAGPADLLLFTRKEPMRFSGSKGRPNERALNRLQATLRAHAPIDVAIFDPLVYLHEAEENSSSEMIRWLVPFREVCRQAGTALLAIHHAGWAPDGEDARGRGSTAIRAWADFELALRAHTRKGRELHRLNLVKTNFAPRWRQHLTLELDSSTLRFRVVDETGTLCPPEDLVAWLREEHGGVWSDKREALYEAICEQFGCEHRTAQEAVKRAKDQRLLQDHGQRKPLEAAPV